MWQERWQNHIQGRVFINFVIFLAVSKRVININASQITSVVLYEERKEETGKEMKMERTDKKEGEINIKEGYKEVQELEW